MCEELIYTPCMSIVKGDLNIGWASKCRVFKQATNEIQTRRKEMPCRDERYTKELKVVYVAYLWMAEMKCHR